MKIAALKSKIAQFHSIVQDHIKTISKCIRDSSSQGCLPNFSEGDFVPVAKDGFTDGKNLFLFVFVVRVA